MGTFDVPISGEYFLRQRRNLILTSLFIIFFKVGKLEVKKIELLGNETDVGNPSIVAFALGVVFLYFLWRYYTYSGEMGGVSNFVLDYQGRAEDRCREYIAATISNKKHKFSRNDVGVINRNGYIITFRVAKDAYTTKDVKLKWMVVYYRLASIVPTIFNKSSFSEYVVPYILAILAIAEFFGIAVIECAMRLVGSV